MYKSKYFFIRISYFLIVVLSLTACSTHTFFGNLNTPPAQNLFGNPLPNPASYYLAQAASSSSPDKEKYQLLAVQAHLQAGHATLAEEQLDNINVLQLPPQLVVQKQLLNARLELLRNNTTDAIQTLTNLEKSQSLNAKDEISFRRIMAAAYVRSNNFIAAVQEYLHLNRQLSGTELKQNQRAIWSTLQNLSETDLQSLQDSGIASNNETLRGWLQLAYIAKAYGNDSTMLNQQINAWRRQFPNHSANQFLPDTISGNGQLFQAGNGSGRVVLLLPLSGRYATAGKALRNGFMNAYYDANSRKAGREDVTIYDTNKASIGSLYDKAVESGASMIIGPLRKEKVDELMSRGNFSVPTLALNYSQSSYSEASNFYQFGLSPKDEAEQAAIKAWRDGKSRAIIIAPSGQWGTEIADTFASTFSGQGGTVIQSLRYTNKQNLSHVIKKLLQVDDSAQRMKDLEHATDRKLSFTPRRREDMDMFFLVASPSKAQTIRPLLKFYYAGEIPVYATSAIYTGIPSRADRDLDGILFCDIPFVLNNSSTVTKTRRDLAHLWSNNFDHYVRLYALGMDAYSFSAQPARLAEMQQFPYRGQSGYLSMDSRGRIYRQLSWAKMEHGRPVQQDN